MQLQQKAEYLSQHMFLGGPPELFEVAGRMQLVLLLRQGLYPDSKVLDIGCGCLRAGYWLIHFLQPGSYCGLEPNRLMLDAGIREFLEPGLVQAKRPRFDCNAGFDFSLFSEKFDFFLARSVWTHAAKPQICAMLDGYVQHCSEEGVFLTSYLRATNPEADYQGNDWIGISHQSEKPGMIRHRFEWIADECIHRGLQVEEIYDESVNFGGQIWLRITKHPSGCTGQA